MRIVFSSNITEVVIFGEKALRWDTSLILRKGKRKIGTKFLIFPIYEQIEGLFYRYSEEYWGTIEEYNKSYSNRFVTPDGKFYYKPHCRIHMNNGQYNEVFFETVEELNEYVNELKTLASHIILK
jgi:hypothetical protein